MRKWIDLFESENGIAGFLKDLLFFTESHGGWHDSQDTEHTFSTDRWYTTLKDVGSAIEIASIDVNMGYRQKGLGQQVMQELCRLADLHRVRLTLVADETNDTVEDDSVDDDEYDGYDEEHWLQNWYSRLGFDYTGHTSDYGPWMERLPS